VITVENLTVHYSVKPALKDVSFRVDRGELVVVVGPNGMGKSTLLGALGGVISPHRGRVEIDGKVRRRTTGEELAIRKTAVFLPDQAWLPAMATPRNFLLAVGRLYDVPDDQLFVQIEQSLKLFEIDARGDSPISSCSAGQKKKVALCAALVTEAPVLLLDEPFSGGLDPAGILALKRILQWRVAEKGSTIVLSSPVPEIVEEIAGRLLILRDGEIVAFDTVDGLRRTTGVPGSLGQVLQHLLYPGMAANLDNYFAGRDRV
jgi:ABC-type multidrug transport system ATPase subunit